MEPVKRFRLVAVRLSTVITLVTGGVAFVFDKVVAHALLLGGLGGVLGFWIVAIQVEKLATRPADTVHSRSIKWTFLQYAIYAAVLGRAFTLDRSSVKGMIAGVAGLFIIQLVVAFLGLTGLDRRVTDRDAEGEDK